MSPPSPSRRQIALWRNNIWNNPPLPALQKLGDHRWPNNLFLLNKHPILWPLKTARKLRIAKCENAHSRFPACGRKQMMKNKRSQKRINHCLTEVLIVAAALALIVSAPGTLAEYPNDQANVSVQVQTISDPTAAGRATDPSRAASATELERAVTRAAQQHRLHPALFFAVMKAESSFNPIVVSKAGAVGLMQL